MAAGLSSNATDLDWHRKSLFFLAARRVPIPGTLIWLTLGWIVRFDIAAGYALLWSLSGAAIFLIRSALLRVLIPSLERDWRIQTASRVVTVCGALLGTLAAIGALVIFPNLSIERQALLSMIYVGWFAGGVGGHGTFPRWFHIWAVPLMGSLIIAWLLQGTATGVAIAALLVMLSAMLLSTLRDYTRQIVHSSQLQSALSERTEQLEHALTVKASFMAATSHDLRQPVTSLGLLNYALQQSSGPDDSRAIAQKMTAPIEALRSMLSALMEISQLESNALTVRPELFGLDAFFHRLANEYREQLHGRPVVMHVTGQNYSLRADQQLIERITRNLLSNAVKYTTRGTIHLSYTVASGQLTLRVTDTGVGISKEDQTKIFIDYFQVDRQQHSRESGLGLGLAIVDRITRLLNGSIQLESEPGKGSSFQVMLPVSDASALADPLTSPSVARSEQRSLCGRDIMIVDDDRLVRESVTTLLQLSGATVRSFGSGDQALLELTYLPKPPELALIDYQLSGERNGVDLLHRLRLQHPNLQAILLTGNTDPRLAGEVEHARARLLHKPVRPERLLQIIENTAIRATASAEQSFSQTNEPALHLGPARA